MFTNANSDINGQSGKRESNLFEQKGVDSDIFYIDTTMTAPIYCAPLKSKVQFTDYFPPEFVHFQQECQKELEGIKGRMAE